MREKPHETIVLLARKVPSAEPPFEGFSLTISQPTYLRYKSKIAIREMQATAVRPSAIYSRKASKRQQKENTALYPLFLTPLLELRNLNEGP
jgi:hypothetical protein